MPDNTHKLTRKVLVEKNNMMTIQIDVKFMNTYHWYNDLNGDVFNIKIFNSHQELISAFAGLSMDFSRINHNDYYVIFGNVYNGCAILKSDCKIIKYRNCKSIQY